MPAQGLGYNTNSRNIDASSYLKKQGWRGLGHSLDPTDRGIARPILYTRKSDNAGLGKKNLLVADQWWMRAFDSSLKNLGSKEKSALVLAREGAGVQKSGLYGFFVKGTGLEGTFGELSAPAGDLSGDPSSSSASKGSSTQPSSAPSESEDSEALVSPVIRTKSGSKMAKVNKYEAKRKKKDKPEETTLKRKREEDEDEDEGTETKAEAKKRRKEERKALKKAEKWAKKEEKKALEKASASAVDEETPHFESGQNGSTPSVAADHSAKSSAPEEDAVHPDRMKMMQNPHRAAGMPADSKSRKADRFAKEAGLEKSQSQTTPAASDHIQDTAPQADLDPAANGTEAEAKASDDNKKLKKKGGKEARPPKEKTPKQLAQERKKHERMAAKKEKKLKHRQAKARKRMASAAKRAARKGISVKELLSQAKEQKIRRRDQKVLAKAGEKIPLTE